MRFRLYPPPKNVDGGNQITAIRWVEFLNSLDHQAEVCKSSSDNLPDADVLIFFNAAISADEIVKIKNKRPNQCVVVVLSGTDLQDFRLVLPETQSAIAIADAIVVYEESAIEKLPDLRMAAKTVVVPHSFRVRELRNYQFESGLNIIAVSHIRPEKNLDRYFLCLKSFVNCDSVNFHHVGGTLDQQPTAEIANIVSEIPNLTMHGKKSHDETVAMIRAADLLVHPSTVEGFPNVVVEALANSTPVAVSRIKSHTTTLSARLPSELFFDANCKTELRSLLQKFIDDQEFRARMDDACHALADQFGPKIERKGLVELLEMIRTAIG